MFCLWHAIQVEDIVYLQSDVLSSLYSSSASQLNLGCFITCPSSLGPTFCALSVLATAVACIAAFVTSVSACTIASLILSVHLLLYVYVLFLIMPAYMRLLLLTPCNISCFSEIPLADGYMCIYCCYMSL